MPKTEKKAPPAFIFGKRPEHIESTVKFPLPDGTQAEVKVQFVYRTRKEFGALWDEVAASGQELAKPIEGEPITYEGLMGKGNAANAKSAMKYIAGWEGVPVELSEASLEQLFDEAPAALQAFWEAYRSAVLTGHLGN
jgi:isopentenyl diphosphate isomerase/L-lactate dehydrogenase-like FMN-dependent dehydrogenase